MNNTLKRILTASTLSLSASLVTADVSFIELPIEGRVGGGHGWMEVSDNGEVVFAKYKNPDQTYGLGELLGLKWSQSQGVSLISDSFYIGMNSAPQYVSIDNDGDTTVFGHEVYRNGELVLTTNVGADKHLTSLSPDGQNVGIRSYYDGPSAQNIDSQEITPLGSGLPNENYIVADYSNNSESVLLSPMAVNFHAPEPFYIKQPNNSYYEVPHQFGSIADLSGNGSTVIGRSFICDSGQQHCTLISNPGGTFEISDANYFPEGLNYDGSIAVLSFRDYANSGWQGYIWDEVNGLRNIVDILATNGIDISDWTQVRMYNISDNGHYIVGEGKNPSGIYKIFMIDATPQCKANGLI